MNVLFVLKVVVMASDKGKVPMHGFATVRINLLDVNDNSPVFMQAGFSGFFWLVQLILKSV